MRVSFGATAALTLRGQYLAAAASEQAAKPQDSYSSTHLRFKIIYSSTNHARELWRYSSPHPSWAIPRCCGVRASC
ncbi:hypothetical protein PF010_g31228 [Phytophthora fragariae]|uniref:Uncharacterized protein n=1 Tax=Phytophthora fragariae TaxID=53985 RepID=A0A6G0JI49_9STRA|nr:hypothetical protein PF003_g1125 [Phytophthora fragariae]KAE9057831.1 hypothetical protein PF010_g31228 [Phytophthora fragariae]